MACILVVDDEEMARDLLRQALERDGHEVVAAEDGETALTQFREQSVDLVITDLFMPKMDGLELINTLRGERPGIKIIAISGSVYQRRRRFLEIAERIEGVTSLAKPFTPQQLRTVVANVLA